MPKPTAGFSNKLNEAKKSVAKLQTEQAKMISKIKKHPCRIWSQWDKCRHSRATPKRFTKSNERRK